MWTGDQLTTQRIHSVFADEIAEVSGTVTDVFDDGQCLFVRSVLPRERKVATGDSTNDGIALRATDTEICLHPYVFRQVCRNGAIIAHTLQSRQIEGIQDRTLEDIEQDIREAVHACCDEDAFVDAWSAMRSSRDARVDMVLNLMPLLSRFPSSTANQLLRSIMQEFASSGDTSRYSLLNAITAVARETRDPDQRWRLEEFGGGILAPTPWTPSLDPIHAMEAAGARV